MLAERPADEDGESEPVLVVHRYGKGRVGALATASTWRWQMLNEADDTSHDRFWRQMVRWLVASTPGPVNVDMPRSQYRPGERPDQRFAQPHRPGPYQGADAEHENGAGNDEPYHQQ